MILVSGGTGLLGSHLLLELAKQQKQVVAIKRPTSNLKEVEKVFARYSKEGSTLFESIRWVDVDLEDSEEILALVKDAARVYHCAAQVSFHPRENQRMIDFNVKSTENIVNACLAAGGKRLLHVSSSSAIGDSPDASPAHEGLIWSGNKTHTPYAVSKFQSEMVVWRGIEEGLDAVIVNPTIILGAGFWDHGSSALFKRVAGGMKYSTTGQTGYVGVLDVVKAMTLLMESETKGERFILSSENLTYAEIMEKIAAELGSPRRMKLLSPSSLLWMARLDAFRGLFSGKRAITSIQAKAAFNQSSYNSQKVIDTLGIKFTPVEKVVREICGYYTAG